MMLARRGLTDIHVYERLPAPASSDDVSVWSDTAKFYLIGLGGRGQKALQELDAWERVEQCCTYVLGRKDWAPGASEDEGVERIFGNDRPYKMAVIPRDRLAGVLREVLIADDGTTVTLHYGSEMTGVRWDADGMPVIAVTDVNENADGAAAASTAEIKYNLLVGADGAARTLAAAMESDDATQTLRVTRYEDDNRRVYKTIPMSLPASSTSATTWRGDVNYSARTKDGRVVFDALPANADGEYCAVLLLKADDEFAQPGSDAAGLCALIDETLPQFAPLISEVTLTIVAAKPASNLPAFRYVGPTLQKGASTVLLGDVIHTVKPYFGLSANSALEDVIALRTALDEHPRDTASAILLPSRRHALVRRRLFCASPANSIVQASSGSSPSSYPSSSTASSTRSFIKSSRRISSPYCNGTASPFRASPSASAKTACCRRECGPRCHPPPRSFPRATGEQGVGARDGAGGCAGQDDATSDGWHLGREPRDHHRREG